MQIPQALLIRLSILVNESSLTVLDADLSVPLKFSKETKIQMGGSGSNAIYLKGGRAGIQTHVYQTPKPLF